MIHRPGYRFADTRLSDIKRAFLANCTNSAHNPLRSTPMLSAAVSTTQSQLAVPENSEPRNNIPKAATDDANRKSIGACSNATTSGRVSSRVNFVLVLESGNLYRRSTTNTVSGLASEAGTGFTNREVCARRAGESTPAGTISYNAVTR